jgi:hypothetical protein
MQNKKLILLVLTGIICMSTANASTIATVTALKSPVRLQQDNTKTELRRNSKLKIGDSIETGDTGRVEMQLWVNATLRLNSNSKITIRAADRAGVSVPDRYPELYIHHGRACINYIAQSSSEKQFIVNLGDRMFAAIHLRGDICVFRGNGLSAIKLRAGSVQVTHSVDPNTLILSETGTEFHIADNGSYELLFPGNDDASTLEIEKPFIVEIVEEDASGESLDNVGSNNAVTEVLPAAETETTGQDTALGNIYTVHLFSSRSEEAAEQVNQKFQKAGHDTQVYASDTDAGRYYRVAITGFVSRHAAQNFSDAIVGRLGVTGTWIAKERPPGVEAVMEQSVSGESLDNVGSNYAATEIIPAAVTETTGQDTVPGNIYTVYLFSSRSEEVAGQVNQKFQKAGHDTQVYVGTIGAELRFRVAVSGFETRQAAKNYSDAIVGTLGVTETWIRQESR